MTQTNIEQALEDGFKKAASIVYSEIQSSLIEIAESYVADAVSSWNTGRVLGKGKNLTGNTVTSMTAGVYMQGILGAIITSQSLLGLKPPIRVKMRKRETFNGIDYDDIKRHWSQATVDTDGGYGVPFAISFLKSYNFPKDECGIVMTTGAEYSEYNVKMRHYDVLVGTHSVARNLANLEWKKIKV